MRERLRFEREIQYLALEVSSPSVRPSPNVVDADAAEPVFTGPVRRPSAPLPDVTALKKAIQWNKKMHPKVSGISLAELRARIERYIDRPALDNLVRQANAGAATPSYDSDEATIVTLLAEQFQRKTCRKPTVGDVWKQCTTDGTVAEDTLDALGFVYHLGNKKDLNIVDLVNKTADATLKRVSATEFKGVEPGLTAKTWWMYMVRPPWLGMPIKHGIHLVLLKRLRQAQRFLMGLRAYENLSPAELGKMLGLEEEHKGARPWTATKSMHTFGLGIDISYTHNPWLSNPQRDTGSVDDITLRAAQFIGGKPRNHTGITPRLLHRIAVNNQDTAKIYKVLSEWNDWLGAYFALTDDQRGIESRLPVLNAMNPDIGFIQRRESLPNAARRWAGTIKTDFNNFAKAVARGGRDKEAVRNGFMNLPRDLVLALREYACLAWGMVDFGPGENGDTMHFDCRVDGIGRAVRIATGNSAPTEGHRCIPPQQRGTAHREFEYETPQTPPKGLRFKFESKVIPKYKDAARSDRSTGCSVFVPKVQQNQKQINLLVFFHGHDTCSPAHNFDPDNIVRLFRLDNQVANGQRHIALAVPAIYWVTKIRWSEDMKKDEEKLKKYKESEERAKENKRRIREAWSPARLNAFVEEVLDEIGKNSTARPSLLSLAIAGHSRAYDIMTPLADEFDKGAADTAKGALAKLDEVWAFDSTYGFDHAKALKKWAEKLGAVQFTLVLNKPKYSLDCKFEKGKTYSPIKYWDCAIGKAKLPKNLTVHKVSKEHCDIPKTWVENLLFIEP